jgi:hypothetical protein
MRINLIVIFLVVLSKFVSGQINDKVVLTDFIRETQQWNRKDGRMTMAWWVPNEYWRIALKDNKQISKETIDRIENLFEEYVMVGVCDLKINADATMDFTEESKMRKDILLIDKDGAKYHALSKDDVNSETLELMESIKPMLTQLLGQFGNGLSFFFFSVKDKDLIVATQQGEFKVIHSKTEFKWKLPLVSLLPPKHCPIDNEEMKGNWLYCPVHGKELDK